MASTLSSGNLSMVWLTTFDGVGAVNLLEQHDECEFVLQGERGQSPDCIGILPESLGVAVGGSDKQ